MQDQGNKMLIEIEVNSEIEVSDLAEAHLADNGLLAGKMIELKLKKGNRLLGEGDTLISKKAASMMATLSEKANPLMSDAGKIMQNVNKLVSEFHGTATDVKSLLKNALLLSHF